MLIYQERDWKIFIKMISTQTPDKLAEIIRITWPKLYHLKNIKTKKDS